MDVTIALAPELKLDAATVRDAWNSRADTRAIGTARLDSGGSTTFLDPLLTGILIGVATSVGSQVFGQALYDLLKQLINPDQPQTFVIVPVEQPDGSTIYIAKPQ